MVSSNSCTAQPHNSGSHTVATAAVVQQCVHHPYTHIYAVRVVCDRQLAGKENSCDGCSERSRHQGRASGRESGFLCHHAVPCAAGSWLTVAAAAEAVWAAGRGQQLEQVLPLP